jgi:hypothetical protein
VREKFVRLQQIATLLNLDQVRACVLCASRVSSDGCTFGEVGRRCGRILQWFWDHVEVERAGGADDRWTQAISVKCTSTLTFAHE